MAETEKKSYVKEDLSPSLDPAEIGITELLEAPIPEGSLDPVYERKARVLNSAVRPRCTRAYWNCG